MLDFAVKVTAHSAAIETPDFEELRRHGFTDSDIWDIGAVAAPRHRRRGGLEHRADRRAPRRNAALLRQRLPERRVAVGDAGDGSGRPALVAAMARYLGQALRRIAEGHAGRVAHPRHRDDR